MFGPKVSFFADTLASRNHSYDKNPGRVALVSLAKKLLRCKKVSGTSPKYFLLFDEGIRIRYFARKE